MGYKYTFDPTVVVLKRDDINAKHKRKAIKQ